MMYYLKDILDNLTIANLVLRICRERCQSRDANDDDLFAISTAMGHFFRVHLILINPEINYDKDMDK